MQRSCTVWLSVALALSLSGCVYEYEIDAVELEGNIAFVPGKHKGTGCLNSFKVTSETGEVVWEIDSGRYLPPPCKTRFPVFYASIPSGFTEKVAAEPLKPGVLYNVEAWDGDMYSGAFRFRQGIIIENVDNKD